MLPSTLASRVQPYLIYNNPSFNFRLISDALASYAEETGIDLTQNSFADMLQLSDSSDTVLGLLEEQRSANIEMGTERLINSVKPAVHVLHAFSRVLGEKLAW